MKPALILIAVFAVTLSSNSFADGGHDYPPRILDRPSYPAQTPDAGRTDPSTEKLPSQATPDDALQEKVDGASADPSVSKLIHRVGP
ncbi:hypothetical protein [uncultured Caballeronia sp.]|jgi:hypothetical protein|uniref:hypothetical protein n=1 Tax=uncultured Caballeronia sp. TaxID=1827198 RepID=UPI0015776A00